jgi:hypothetical protein
MADQRRLRGNQPAVKALPVLCLKADIAVLEAMVGRRFIDFFRRKVKKRTEQRSHGSVSDTQHCKKAYKLAWSLECACPACLCEGCG